ncbi:MAG: reactive intermediate/imine deaminase [Deltaproteobacteria bacterium]|nr:reactive intermediate/imine deaminase [Candidatus Zymogenaceae bacterium]
MKTCIEVTGLPKAGPYSHAVRMGGLIFVSGNVAFDPDTGKAVKGDIPQATKVILSNIERTLAAAGSDLSKVVKTTIFLTDMGTFSQMNEVYGKVFADNPPARSTVGVKELPGGYDIEIEVIAGA